MNPFPETNVSIGIPTIGIKGIEYRSRLEAKYAELFGLLNWEWDYEPIDLRSYIPDFMIYFKNKLLVEIKGDIDKDFQDAFDKLVNSDWNHSCLFLGSRYKGILF